jgi:alpha-1,2-mannosyltransferase
MTAQLKLVSSALPYWMNDFLVYRGGGNAVVHNLRIYQIGINTASYANMQFIYTPFAAVLLAPISLLSTITSEVVWTFLSFLALGGAIWVSLRIAGVNSRRVLTIAMAGGMVAAYQLSPVMFNMLLGQINLFVMILVLVDFLPGMPPRWRGIGIGVAAGLKLTPLLFVVYLVLTRRWRDALRSVAGFAATVLIAFAIVPADSRSYWFHGIFYNTSRMVPGNILVNHSLPGLFARLAHTPVPPNWSFLVSLAVGAILVAAAVWAHRVGQDMLGMVVISFTAQLISPVSWMHHAVWIVPALIWLGFATWRAGTVLPRVVLGAATIWYLVPVWVQGQKEVGSGPDQWTTSGDLLVTLTGNLVPFVLAMVLFPIWVRRLRPPRSPISVPDAPALIPATRLDPLDTLST